MTIADDAVFVIEGTGQQLSLDEYRNYARQAIVRAAPSREALRAIWVDPTRRRAFLDDLRRSSIHPEVLAEVLQRPEADAFDLLCHLAFGAPLVTRGERVTAFLNREQAFLAQHSEQARKVVLELLEKYRVGGMDELRGSVFGISPFQELGGAVTISKWFGGPEGLQKVLRELHERMYPDAEVA